MKKLLIGAALGALLLPASVAVAQVGGDPTPRFRPVA